MAKSGSTAAQLNHALRLHRQGDIGGAAQLYRQIIDSDPKNADAYQLLGVIARQTGKRDLALQLFASALQHNPRHAPALTNHALVLRESGDLAAARKQAEAATRADPAYAEAHIALGGILQAERNPAEAMKHYRKALQHQPNNPDLHNDIANAEHRLGRLPAAYAAIASALQLNPDAPYFYNTKGNILRAAGYPDLACAAFAEAYGRDPTLTDAMINEALTHLLIGDFSRGWDMFAHRKEHNARYAALAPWDGKTPQAKVLLRAEQGLGDTLQFIRLLPWARERAAALVLEAQAPLRKLIAHSYPDLTIITPDDPIPAALTHQCRLMDLAHLMPLGADRIPGSVPYLSAPKIALPPVMEACPTPRIGLVWAGNPDHLNDANRSLKLAQLRQVLEPYANHMISLQKGPQAEELKQWPIIDGGALLDDFTTTAAMLNGIDLLITVDTSVAHLAGALGRPVWLLLPYDHDWRWQLERRDVPWYPSAKLYRQQNPGAWNDVLREVGRDLDAFIGGDRSVLNAPAWSGPSPRRQQRAAMPLRD